MFLCFLFFLSGSNVNFYQEGWQENIENQYLPISFLRLEAAKSTVTKCFIKWKLYRVFIKAMYIPILKCLVKFSSCKCFKRYHCGKNTCLEFLPIAKSYNNLLTYVIRYIWTKEQLCKSNKGWESQKFNEFFFG